MNTVYVNWNSNENYFFKSTYVVLNPQNYLMGKPDIIMFKKSATLFCVWGL